MKYFIKFILATSRKTIILIIALGALNGFTSAGLIALVSQLFANPGDLGRDDLLIGAVILGLVVVFMLGLEITVRYVLTKHVAEIHRELHVKFTQLVLNDQLRRLEKIGFARLVTIFTEDMSLVGGALVSISSVGTSIFVVLGCMGYLFWLSPGIVFTIIVLFVPAFFIYQYMHKKSIKLAKQSLEKRDASVFHFKSM